ncbi:MAG: hypothetical protein ACYDIE_14820, partial [Candidatus Krumholzibacteriia bacterium]
MRIDPSASRARRFRRFGRPVAARGGGRPGVLLLPLLVGALAPPAAGVVPLYFPGQITVPVSAPTAAAVALDVNDDGLLDLIAGLDDGHVVVLRNLREGRFAQAFADASLGGGRVVALRLVPL